MPNWKVELIPEARYDFNSLDGSVKKRVLKQLVKLEQNPKYGEPLGNKAGINLDGYFKLSPKYSLSIYASTLSRSQSLIKTSSGIFNFFAFLRILS